MTTYICCQDRCQLVMVSTTESFLNNRKKKHIYLLTSYHIFWNIDKRFFMSEYIFTILNWLKIYQLLHKWPFFPLMFLWIIQIKECPRRKPWSIIWTWYFTIFNWPAFKNLLNPNVNGRSLYHGTTWRFWMLYFKLCDICQSFYFCYKHIHVYHVS
jgi:CDP-diglyceride synthetase